jgi:hypothetical protein
MPVITRRFKLLDMRLHTILVTEILVYHFALLLALRVDENQVRTDTLYYLKRRFEYPFHDGSSSTVPDKTEGDGLVHAQLNSHHVCGRSCRYFSLSRSCLALRRRRFSRRRAPSPCFFWRRRRKRRSVQRNLPRRSANDIRAIGTTLRCLAQLCVLGDLLCVCAVVESVIRSCFPFPSRLKGNLRIHNHDLAFLAMWARRTV